MNGFAIFGTNVLCVLSLVSQLDYAARKWVAAANLIVCGLLSIRYPEESWTAIMCLASFVAATILSFEMLE